MPNVEEGSAKHAVLSSRERWLRSAADIIELPQFKAAVFEQEGSFRELLEALPIAVYTTDPAGRITFYNQAAVRHWGQSPQLGSSLWCGSWRLFWPDGRPMPREQSPMATALKEDRAIRGAEAISERPDGTRVHFMPFPTPLHDASGAMIGAVNMMVDITERKQAEERLWQLQAELRHLARLGSLGQMAAVLAHEINQPLTALVAYVQSCQRLLRDSKDEQSGFLKSLLDKAAEQALRAGETIRRMREFVSRGNNQRRGENIISLVNEASALALVGARQRGVRVGFQFDTQVECVLADKVQIQQVIVNLVRNAVEAMQEVGQRELLVSVTQAEPDMVEISVADTGPGIDPEVGSQLFQPFVTTKADGMGVGLSICRSIVDAHGGRLWVDPNRPVGTAFRFTLPALVQGDPSNGQHL